jgi:hypothetical protein
MWGTAVDSARVCRAALAVLILAAAVAGLAPAAEASLYWSAPSVIASASLTGLACPNVSLCVGVDESGDVVVSTDPTGGSAAWTSSRIAEAAPFTIPLSDVACAPDGALCIAVGSAGMFTSTDPSGGAPAWHRVAGSQQAGAVSCPDENLCVAASASAVLSSTRPADPSEPWHETALPGPGPIGIDQISCPTSTFCAADNSATEQAAIFTSTEPAGGTTAWKLTTTVSASLTGISCPTASSCVAVGRETVVTSSDPTRGTAAWQAATVPALHSGFPNVVACATPTLCAVAGGNGVVVSSTNPAGGAGAWEAISGVDGNHEMRAVSCPSEAVCFAADEALVTGVAAHRLTVATAGDGEGSAASGPLVCPFGCTYSGPVCPRNCGADSFPNGLIPQRLTEVYCGEGNLADGSRFMLDFCSQLFPATDAPTLTALPRTGSVFTGWSGDCSGRSGCAPQMGAERSVVATFEPTLKLSGVAQRHRRWRESRGRPRVPTGTRFGFTLNRPATVLLEFDRAVPGRRRAGVCHRVGKTSARRHRCVIHARAGTLRMSAAAGPGGLAFTGTVQTTQNRRARLVPGTYSVHLIASTEDESTPAATLTFTIAR